jgi:putative ABC transport system permease protein
MSLALLALPPYGNAPVGALGACVLLTFSMQALLPRLVQLSHRLLLRLGLARMGAALSLAVQNLPRDPGRVAGMASGLMAGVSLTVSVATFVASFITSLNGWTGQLLPGDLFVTSGSGAVATRNLPMDDSLRPQLLAIPGVAQVRRIRLVETRFRDATIKLGVSEFRALFKDGSLILLEGERQPVLRALESGALVVSENFSRTFSVHRGDSVELATAHGTRAFEVAGVVVDYSSDIGAVLMDYATYKQGWSDDRVDTYELRLAAGVDPESVRRTINDRLAEEHDLFVLTNGEFRRSAVKAADQIFVLLQALEIITLLVAALGLMTTVLANVMDRVREIGMLRALGMHRHQVSTMIVAETVVVGAIGTVAGVVLGSALGYIALTRITSVLVGWHLPYQFPFAVIGQLTLVTLAISVVAGMIPARRAASLVVREALDRE